MLGRGRLAMGGGMGFGLSEGTSPRLPELLSDVGDVLTSPLWEQRYQKGRRGLTGCCPGVSAPQCPANDPESFTRL